MTIIKSVILRKNVSSRSEIKAALDHHRQEQAKNKNGIFYPDGFLKPCEGCGKEEFKPELYFGQVFCADCVEKWKAGQK